MSFHHLALATRDLQAAHRFYTDSVGFELAHVDVIALEDGAWFKHVFYDTGGGELLALFEIHDANLTDYRTAISTGLGLPNWVNHIAYAASGLDDIECRKERLLASGSDCVVADHGSCISLYADDPDGNLIEFCYLTAPIVTEEHRRQAIELIRAVHPEANASPPSMEFFSAAR